MQRILRIGIAVCVMLIAALTPMSVSAAGMDPEREASLTLQYTHNGTAYSGLTVQTFRIADVSVEGTYSLCGEFAKYPVTLYNVDSQTEWRSIASTLAAYAVADGISPTCRGTTDSTGIVKFAVQPGMYLTLSATHKAEECITLFETFLVAVPQPDEDGGYLYDVTARPKSSTFVPDGGDVEYTVVKRWKDSANWQDRPDSIAVDIRKDGAPYSTVYLTAEDNWTYRWTAPDDGAIWQIAERDVPEGYTVSVTKEKNTFFVTNIYDSEEESPEMGDVSVLWPYVVLMILSGGALIALSVFRRGNDK